MRNILIVFIVLLFACSREDSSKYRSKLLGIWENKSSLGNQKATKILKFTESDFKRTLLVKWRNSGQLTFYDKDGTYQLSEDIEYVAEIFEKHNAYIQYKLVLSDRDKSECRYISFERNKMICHYLNDDVYSKTVYRKIL